MSHGWTPHGWPCCEQAPLAARPEVVTACAMTWIDQRAPIEICQDCITWALTLLHNRMSFVYVAPEEDWVRYPLRGRPYRALKQERGGVNPA